MDTLLLNVKDLAVKRVTPVHPVDPDFSHIYICANQFLKAWAQTIPQEKLTLIGPRLQTIKFVLEEHPFEILFIWNQPPIEPELCIQYRDRKTTTPLLNVSLTPHLLLFKDLQHNYKEIAFPSAWSA